MHWTKHRVEAEIDSITAWIADTFRRTGKAQAVIAVSGGVDSGLALTLLTKALGADNVWALLLPFDDQDMTDAREVTRFNQIPAKQVIEYDIAPAVQILAQTAGLDIQTKKSDRDQIEPNNIRLGNIKARVRMILVFDLAKKLDALVCGTENKSENMLGYYTRYGDSASDLEPISHLYKTQVYQLAKYLNLPAAILTKPPSAGLWLGQSDEDVFGVSYEQADLVLEALVAGQKVDIETSVAQKITNRVDSQKFKSFVPYKK